MAEALLGGVRRLRAPRRRSSPPTTRSTSSGRRPRPRPRSRARRRPGVVRSVESKRNTRKPPAPFNTTAFTSAASSVGVSPGARDADRRGPLHGRLHLLPAHGQHRLPEVAAGARAAAVDRAGGRLQGGRADRRAARARAHARQEADHRPPADLPDAGARPERAARRRPPQDLRAGRAALRRDVRRPGGVGVHARRHRGRLGDLLRARQRAGRARLPRDLSVRPLQGRGDPEGRGGPGAGARRRRARRGGSRRRTRGSTPRRPSRRRGSGRAS